jgi:hypothetical protein
LGKITEGDRRMGMLGAERFLANRQRTLEEWPRRCGISLGAQQLGEVV